MSEKPAKSAEVPRLARRFREECVPALQAALALSNVMQVPRVTKVVLNMGMGEAVQNAKALDAARADLTAIAGQRPSVRKSKKSIAGFKLRAGLPIGLTVTLRGARMYEFMDRLFNFSLPRIRDFRGVNLRGFDGRGNYTLGVREQIIFPEVDFDKVDRVRGMDVTFVTTAQTDEQGYELLKQLGMPFRQKGT